MLENPVYMPKFTSLLFCWFNLEVIQDIIKASVAQYAARQSHKLKAVSTSLTGEQSSLFLTDWGLEKGGGARERGIECILYGYS